MNLDASQLSPALLQFLSTQKEVQKITVPAATMVCQSGDSCQSLVVILQGQVKVYRPDINGRRITLYHINDKESCVLTASCILNSMPFPAFAETTTEVKGLAIPPMLVKQWLLNEPLWQQFIFGVLSHRMAGLIELVNALAFERLDARLAKWLVLQNNALIKTTHQKIAEELASTREVISRLLKDFEANGSVKLGRGTIQILDIEGLKEI